ncbi:protein IMPAIRED IN BABA-INDUCED STERILITY 1-like [Zingiber officinale]|uniref:protein IMPAIRED IN BABA-INDUCED STERILITY 1-like n=1 Tax=Zingiber officinale TaxID=94328 RepID=UPI001C4C4CA7|nr:protein IMPAIRED IN BABA-INDUCED STERILITY 1-like [Zingiber officinale]
MGCISSKNAVSVPQASDPSGIVRDLRERSDPISASWRGHRGHLSAKQTEKVQPEREEGDGNRLESRENGKVSTDDTGLQNLRLRNLHRYIEGEQVAAGWPSWLSAVAGEAIQGWVPLKADSFEKLEKIGQGTYSSVFKARDLDTGKMVALKKVRFDNFKPESVRFMAREIKILRMLDHPNIMKLEGLIASRLSQVLYLVFEYMEHDLAGLSTSPDIVLSESQVKCYMKQLLSGLEYCHSRNVIHRDIKGANLLINNDGILKVADFGLANLCRPGHKQPLTSRVVTLWYRAPELLLGSTDYEATVDLWSVGCVFAEMFAKRPILRGRTEVEQLHKIFRLCGSPPEEFWQKLKLPHATIFKPHHPYKSTLHQTLSHLPRTVVCLLENFLSVEPYKRGSASAALDSEYFREMPYASEPSSLPKYSPTKEMTIKNQESLRRRVSGSQESMRKPSEVDIRKLAGSKKELQLHAEEVSKHYDPEELPRLDGETRLFVDLQPMPSIKCPDVQHTKHNPQPDFTFSGSLCVSSSSGFSWARRLEEDHAYRKSHRQCSSRSNLSHIKDSSGIEHIKQELEIKGAANSDLVGGQKRHESQELAKCTILKKCSQQSEHPKSLDTSKVFRLHDNSEALHKGDPLSMQHNYPGFHKEDRVEFSGPLLPQTCKFEEFLQKHEHQICQEVRRSWFRRVTEKT